MFIFVVLVLLTFRLLFFPALLCVEVMMVALFNIWCFTSLLWPQDVWRFTIEEPSTFSSIVHRHQEQQLARFCLPTDWKTLEIFNLIGFILYVRVCLSVYIINLFFSGKLFPGFLIFSAVLFSRCRRSLSVTLNCSISLHLYWKSNKTNDSGRVEFFLLIIISVYVL